MTPEKRAREFIDQISDGWGEPTESQDAAALALVIRAAENDALERAAERAAQLPNTAMAGMAAASIRELKHPI